MDSNHRRLSPADLQFGPKSERRPPSSPVKDSGEIKDFRVLVRVSEGAGLAEIGMVRGLG